MAAIVIPNVGIAMEEALVVKWLKQPGEDVATDEPVLEIETDKTTMDIVSPAEGTLGPHLFEPGAVVPVGMAVAYVVREGEPAEAEAAPPRNGPGGVPAAEEQPTDARPAHGSESSQDERRPHALSPRARRLAQAQSAEPATTHSGGRFRELIAAKVSESWREIPHFAVSRDVDAEPMLATLDQLRAGGLEPSSTLTDLLLRALALALRETGHAGSIDVGLAVATPHGVVIPVVRDVLGQDGAMLATARKGAVERARAGRLSPEDLAAPPATTLSNLGQYGVDQFTGIIALGQTSLLTVGRAVPRAVADADHSLRVRTTFNATLNADHRTVDGAEAARLLAAFARAAEAMTSVF